MGANRISSIDEDSISTLGELTILELRENKIAKCVKAGLQYTHVCASQLMILMCVTMRCANRNFFLLMRCNTRLNHYVWTSGYVTHGCALL